MYSPLGDALDLLQNERPDLMKADILEARMRLRRVFNEADQAGRLMQRLGNMCMKG